MTTLVFLLFIYTIPIDCNITNFSLCLLSIGIFQPQVKSLYVLELMSYKVVSNALRITAYQNHFTSCSLLIEGIKAFKAFFFFSADLSVQLNQALNWSTGFVLLNFNDKVCSFYLGVHSCTLLTQKQSSKHSAEATRISGEERTSPTHDRKNFSFVNTWHYYT